jgi:hypothetical protein
MPLLLLRKLIGFSLPVPVIVIAITMGSTALFAYMYKGALEDVARVRAEAQRDATIAANRRAGELLDKQAAAFLEREQAFMERLAEVDRAAARANERAIEAERRLRDIDTERLADTSEEYAAWKDASLPPSVVSRLRGVQVKPVPSDEED